MARSIPWQSGVIAAFSFAPRPWLRVGTSYEFLAPAQLESPSGFSLWRHGVALTLAGVVALAKRVDLELRLGGEVELSRWRSDAAGRGRLRAIPRLGLDASLQIELGRGVAIDVGPGLAVALVDVDFVTCARAAASCAAGPNRQVVVDAWRVRPRARAGISVQF
ncbi:MAG: hypothetical protein IAG13_19565 [Deltaproteobacteria bacterium]|nr:hypothetical protein [Nannocystaceae bacterium]